MLPSLPSSSANAVLQAPVHGDMLFVSTLDGSGLMAYKPGSGMASIDKSIYQNTRPFSMRPRPDLPEDRCVTSKQTKVGSQYYPLCSA